MKKYLCIICLLIFLCGCREGGSYMFLNHSEHETKTSWDMSYSKSDGYSQRTINMDTSPQN